MRPIYGTVGVPTFGNVSIEWSFNFHHLAVGLAVYVVYTFVKGKRVDHAKNEICKQALVHDADWVFLLDDDVLPPQDTLLKMLKQAFGPPYLDIINGVYYSKTNPPIPLMFKGDMKGSFWDWHVGDLVEVDAAGAGCTLIKTKVLKALKPPYFSVNYAMRDDALIPDAGTTEDLYFYKKCRDAGFKIWIDTSIQCMHEDRRTGMFYSLPADYPQAIIGSELKPRGKKLILDIGCGEYTPYFAEGTPVRLDNDPNCKPDILANWTNIPEPDQKYNVIYASHALEHVGFKQVLTTLKEWLRVLKVGGELRLIVPNLLWAVKNIQEGVLEKGKREVAETTMWVLYSAQKDENDFHKSGFTPKTLKKLLKETGCLDKIKVWTSDGGFNDWKNHPGSYNILAKAIKTKHEKPESIVDPKLKDYHP